MRLEKPSAGGEPSSKGSNESFDHPSGLLFQLFLQMFFRSLSRVFLRKGTHSSIHKDERLCEAFSLFNTIEREVYVMHQFPLGRLRHVRPMSLKRALDFSTHYESDLFQVFNLYKESGLCLCTSDKAFCCKQHLKMSYWLTMFIKHLFNQTFMN